MFARFLAKYGRRLLVWAVVAVFSSLARKALARWAAGDDPIETTGASTA